MPNHSTDTNVAHYWLPILEIPLPKVN